MLTKKQVLEWANVGEGALGKAADDEPVFVLRAQDCHAADLVEKWATWVSVDIGSAGDGAKAKKVAEARQIAEEMRRWPVRKNPD